MLLVDFLKESEPDGPQSNITRDVQPVVPAAGGKIKVMKRSTSGNNVDKKAGADKTSSTFIDKEKAYAEARARIFGVEISVAPSDSEKNNKLDASPGGNPATSGNTAGGAGTSSVNNSQTPVLNSGIKSEQELNSGKIDIPSLDALQIGSTEGAQLPAKKSTNKSSGPAVDTASWKGKNKNVMRDKDAERSDPDFTRNRQFPPPVGVPYGYGSGNATSGPDPMAYGQHQYGMEYSGAPAMQYMHHPPQPPQVYFAHPGPVGYMDQNFAAPIPNRGPTQYANDPYNSNGRGWVGPGPSSSPPLAQGPGVPYSMPNSGFYTGLGAGGPVDYGTSHGMLQYASYEGGHSAPQPTRRAAPILQQPQQQQPRSNNSSYNTDFPPLG